MDRVRLTPELVEKAKKVFQNRKMVYTGEGLTRTELRTLRRQKLVDTKLSQRGGPATLLWFPTDKFRSLL